MMNFIEGWYVCYTRPRHEKKVAAKFAEWAIQYFLPTIKTIHTWHDRKKYVDAPLFPSYIFVYLRDKPEYYNSLEVEGVLHYIKWGKTIARINESVIADIRIAIASDKDIYVSQENFQPGRRLVISQGPLTGLSCEIIEFKGKQKFLVRVNLLQRNLLVEFPSESLMAI